MSEVPMEQVKTGLLASVVRTVVPMLVGFVVALLAKANLELDGETVAALTSAITIAVGTAYYAVVRVVEQRVGPAWGWLLGKAGAPTYKA